jgi:hypothetical protein
VHKKRKMELAKLVRASGFFLSSVVTISLAVMLLVLAQSNLISLFEFSFIIPLFIASIILRGVTWKKLYNSSHKLVYFVTYLLVFIFGFAFLIGFLACASTQTILYPLPSYSGFTWIFFISLFWVIYSASEFFSIYGLFRGGLLWFTKFIIAAILLVEASLLFIIGAFSYALPISLFFLAAMTTLTGLGFLFKDTFSS